jgi:hypothetical protein
MSRVQVSFRAVYGSGVMLDIEGVRRARQPNLTAPRRRCPAPTGSGRGDDVLEGR